MKSLLNIFSIESENEEKFHKDGYGPVIKDIDGNNYKTVYIGTQEWMAENLKVTKYNDGTAIPNVKENKKWFDLRPGGGWCYYNNDAANNKKYGKLYNWYVVCPITNGNKNVCPAGWHVPTYPEWSILTDYLGFESIAGGKMKEVGIKNWKSPNLDATNISLFTGLPGGYRNWDGEYTNIGYSGYWWSSTEYDRISAFWYILLHNDRSTHSYNGYEKEYGFSVRCIKD